jgi:hypothetical protein
LGIWPSKISHLPAQKGGFLFILDSNDVKYFFEYLQIDSVGLFMAHFFYEDRMPERVMKLPQFSKGIP